MTTLTQNQSLTRKTVYAALFIAIGIVLPIAFHSIPNAGGIFLPMHIPVLLSGIICGSLGIACGILTPLLSCLLTSMPPVAILPSMVCELATYATVAWLLTSFLPIKNFYARIYTALIGAMLAGRLVYGALNALFFRAGNYSMQIWISAGFIVSWPGILIQILAIPAILATLQKAKLIDQGYEKKQAAKQKKLKEE